MVQLFDILSQIKEAYNSHNGTRHLENVYLPKRVNVLFDCYPLHCNTMKNKYIKYFFHINHEFKKAHCKPSSGWTFVDVTLLSIIYFRVATSNTHVSV